jgi:hypothetical protein
MLKGIFGNLPDKNLTPCRKDLVRLQFSHLEEVSFGEVCSFGLNGMPEDRGEPQANSMSDSLEAPP